jgi:hypothetical protein
MALRNGDRVIYGGEIYWFESNGPRFCYLYIREADVGDKKRSIYQVRQSDVKLYAPPPPRNLRRIPSPVHPLSISDEDALASINLIRALRGLPPWTSL